MGKERGGIMVNDLKNEILTIIKKKITIIELNQHLSDQCTNMKHFVVFA